MFFILYLINTILLSLAPPSHVLFLNSSSSLQENIVAQYIPPSYRKNEEVQIAFYEFLYTEIQFQTSPLLFNLNSLNLEKTRLTISLQKNIHSLNHVFKEELKVLIEPITTVNKEFHTQLKKYPLDSNTDFSFLPENIFKLYHNLYKLKRLYQIVSQLSSPHLSGSKTDEKAQIISILSNFYNYIQTYQNLIQTFHSMFLKHSKHPHLFPYNKATAPPLTNHFLRTLEQYFLPINHPSLNLQAPPTKSQLFRLYFSILIDNIFIRTRIICFC